MTLPLLGSGRDFLLVTKTLLFAAQQSPDLRGEFVLAARNKATGEVIAEIPLPSRAIGSPMTYELDGPQFIVVTIAGTPPELVALTLP